MKNVLKRRLKAGEQVYGTWITLESPIATEMMSTLGFDYFVFDTEHSPLDIYMAQTLMQGMRGDSKTTPRARKLSILKPLVSIPIGLFSRMKPIL